MQLWSSAPDDCIFSCLGSPRLVQQTPLDTQSQSVLDYVPSYCQEVQVESVVITQCIENEVETSISEENAEMECLDIGLNERSEKQDPVEVSVVEMNTADGGEVSPTHLEEKMKNQKEETDLVSLYTIKQPFVKLEKLNLSGKQFSKTFNAGLSQRGRCQPRKDLQNKTSCRKNQEKKRVTVQCASINKYALIIMINIIIIIMSITFSIYGCFKFLKKETHFVGDCTVVFYAGLQGSKMASPALFQR